MKNLSRIRLAAVYKELEKVNMMLDRVAEADPELEDELFSPAGHISKAMEAIEDLL